MCKRYCFEIIKNVVALLCYRWNAKMLQNIFVEDNGGDGVEETGD